MKKVEMLMLLQTLILFGTGLAVVWYTIETRKMRGATAAQLAIMERNFAIAATRERQAAAPIFLWGPGETNDNTARWGFVNEGGPISNLKVTMQSTGVQPTIVPDQWIGTSRSGQLILQGNVTDEIKFTIGFQTKLGGVFGYFFTLRRGEKPTYTGSGEV